MSSHQTEEIGDISPLEVESEETLKFENTTPQKETGISKEVQILKPELPTVMVAGAPRSGKSTALNNIFGLNLDAKASILSATRVINIIEVIKIQHTQDKVTMQVIDTPGLGALDIPKEEILKDMKRVTKGVSFTLLYCFSVSSNTALTENDKTIITNLHHALGGQMWSKCVLLFTFSDHAYLEFEDCPAEYIRHISNHAQKFQKLLQDISGKDCCVKSIFEYESPEILSEEEHPSNIIAIPVKKKLAQSKDILPGMTISEQDWTDVVFLELMKRTNSTQHDTFILFKYDILIPLKAIAAGMFRGMMAGTAVGIGGAAGYQ